MSECHGEDQDMDIFVEDPVCKKEVHFEKAVADHRIYEYGHKKYVFCSMLCLRRFALNPQSFVGGAPSEDITAECEVCGKQIHTGEESTNLLIDGEVHHFCCPVCASVYSRSHV